MTSLIKKRPWLLIVFFLFFGILVFLYAMFIGTKGLSIKEYAITHDDLSKEYDGLTIVHITDLHYKKTVFEKELKSIVNKINKEQPDIVVLTGDLFDLTRKYNTSDIDLLIKYLKKIDVTIDKYAIRGNHDVEIKYWSEAMEKSGFVNLDNTYDLIYKGYQPIMIAGISSNLNDTVDITDKIIPINEFIDKERDDEEKIATKPIYKILLLHEPDFIDDIDISKFNLILAGHTHGGQVKAPFIGPIILPPKGKTYHNEHYTIGETKLYVSSGVGNSIINVRLFNRPSFNLYRLNSK